MIISVEKAKEEITFPASWKDSKIERKLKAIEQAVRNHTHNNFQDTEYRCTAIIDGGTFVLNALCPFKPNDTININYGKNKGVFTVKETTSTTFTVVEDVVDEIGVTVTKVVYPADVVDCCLNLLEWEINFRDKVGIQSETLSRHSVTYVQQTGDNTIEGYPANLMSGLQKYKKARF